MYKIMTRLHTKEGSIYRYYKIRDEYGRLVEFETEDKEDAAEVAMELLHQVGYLDLRVVDELPYYIDVNKTDDPGITDDDIENAERLLGVVGYSDLLLNHEAKYDIIWHWGIKPEPIKPTYTLTFINDTKGSWEYSEIDGITEGESRINFITIDEEYDSFHLVIDGYDCSEGLPSWIEYLGEHVFKFNDIRDNHEIELIVDNN